MEITRDQQILLDSLVCERLSSSEQNLDLIQTFCNARNDGIAETLRKNAWNDDKEGSVAFYVVKTAQGDVLFFFSLKCGGLHDPLDDKNIALSKKISEILQKIVCEKDVEAKKAAKLIEQIRSGYGLGKDDILEILKKEALEKRLESENENITRVGFTYSGIELVHFCANDLARSIWTSYKMPHSLGTVVFWKMIVPIVLRAKELIGCKYLFLFAADTSDEKSLINFYRNRLHFEESSDLGVLKPLYDLCCKFMSQSTLTLASDAERFWKNFNQEEV